MSNNGTITRPGIRPDTLRAAGVYLDSADPEPGSIGIPYYAIDGSPRPDGFQRWRLPKVRPDGQKYHQLPKTGLQTYFPPRALTWTEVGGDLVIVEGEFKALSLLDAGIHSVGLGGLAAYTNGADGKPQLLAGIAEAVAHWRPERILYLGDSDTATNFEFSRNAAFLAGALDVPVLLPRIPMAGLGKGIDDVREVLGDDFPGFWKEILEKSEPIDRKDKAGQIAVRLLRREGDYHCNLVGRERDRASDRVIRMAVACRDAVAHGELIAMAAEVFGITRSSVSEAVEQHRREAAEERKDAGPASSAPGSSGRPALILPGGDVSITEAADGLFRVMAASGKVFVRGRCVTTLQRNKGGEMVLEPVRPTAARSLFEHYVEPWAWRVGRGGDAVLKRAVIPLETAHAVLDCHLAGDLLPVVAGLTNCPVITEIDGVLQMLGKGYSRETGLLIQRGDVDRNIPLVEAVAALLELLSGFTFQSPGDKSRAMASFLTPALKMGGLLAGYVPADVAEADRSQSGKTYRQRIVAAIYGETPKIVPLKKGGVGSVDEGLFAKLVAGRPFIHFDNFRGHMDSPALEALLTAEGEFPCRLPHLREIDVDPSRFFVMISSNGVESTRDLANRSSIIRIRRRDGAEFPDTLGEVRSRQSYYLGCVFAIVREWHGRGKQRTAETRHDFREWCRTLDWIVRSLCGLDPLMNGHTEAQERTSNPTLTFLRKIAIELERLDRLGEAVGAAQIFELASDADISIPGMKAGGGDEGKGARVIGGKLGAVFKASDDLKIDGYVITRHEEDRCYDGSLKALKKYIFAKRTGTTEQQEQGVQPQENCAVFKKSVPLVPPCSVVPTGGEVAFTEDGKEWARL